MTSSSSSSVEAQLSSLVSNCSLGAAERTSALSELIDSCVARGESGSLEHILERLVSEDVFPRLVSRQAVSHYAVAVTKLSGEGAVESACRHALSTLGGGGGHFDEAEASLRHALFEVLVGEGSFKEAACVLASLNMEARQYSDVEKASTYVKIAETFLEDDESVDAETFVSRASALMHAVPADDWALQLRYRVTLARTLDARRKFLDAAMRYYELSQATRVDPDELVALLAKSVTCAVLGNAGPQRSRILSMLYKDERVSSQMDSSDTYGPHAVVLKKMCTGQLVTKADVANFEANLLPHQKATMADGLTIPDRATVQHNLVALSAVYDNIALDQLGKLLEIDPRKAEKVASRMITDGRLPGAAIDQVDDFIVFAPPTTPIAAFDDHLNAVCAQVNACYDKIDKMLAANENNPNNQHHHQPNNPQAPTMPSASSSDDTAPTAGAALA